MATTEMNFSSLNDDCIFKVLEWLTLDDICMFSRTCKRLQLLCGSHFRRKYPNEVNRKVQFWLDGKWFEKYVKYFHNFVKSLEILSYSEGTPLAEKVRKNSLLVDFVKTKCDQNLHKIGIVGNYGDVDLVAFAKEVESFLRHVQVVEFRNTQRSSQDEAVFLKLCPNVKNLILWRGIPAENVDAILQQKYHQLTHFIYMEGDAMSINVEPLKLFFQQNEKIESVSWTFNVSVNDGNSTEILREVECIQAVSYASNLQHLFLSINNKPLKDAFNVICKHLNVLCGRDNFKSLQLEFESEHGAVALMSGANQMASFKQLTKIHLKGLKLSDVMPALRLLVHSKTIFLNHIDTYGMHAWDNSSDLPQVEDVQLVGAINEEPFKRFLHELLANLVNLKRIFLPAEYHELNIGELNETRRKLKNACQVTIFANRKDNSTNLDRSLVKIKFVEFQTGCDEDPLGYCTLLTTDN